MGRKDDKDTHHEIGLKYLDIFLEQNPNYKEIKEEIKDCILNHRGKGNPQTIYGKIIQVADKVSLKREEWIEYKCSI